MRVAWVDDFVRAAGHYVPPVSRSDLQTTPALRSWQTGALEVLAASRPLPFESLVLLGADLQRSLANPVRVHRLLPVPRAR